MTPCEPGGEPRHPWRQAPMATAWTESSPGLMPRIRECRPRPTTIARAASCSHFRHRSAAMTTRAGQTIARVRAARRGISVRPIFSTMLRKTTEPSARRFRSARCAEEVGQASNSRSRHRCSPHLDRCRDRPTVSRLSLQPGRGRSRQKGLPHVQQPNNNLFTIAGRAIGASPALRWARRHQIPAPLIAWSTASALAGRAFFRSRRD